MKQTSYFKLIYRKESNMKKIPVGLLVLFFYFTGVSQSPAWDPTLQTAKNAAYMDPEEKEMVFEVNKVRKYPARYAREKIFPLLTEAKKTLNEKGKGLKNYSVTTTYRANQTIHDTSWFFVNVEEVKALQTLYDSLLGLKPLRILLPDEGIYRACSKHAADQQKNGSVSHQGNDGSWPWDRIGKYSPKMKNGNENIAFETGGTPESIVILLLIDSGIGGYGHRYNLLDASWTHVACYHTKKPGWKETWWIQNFGEIK
jgi:hypothetical protein